MKLSIHVTPFLLDQEDFGKNYNLWKEVWGAAYRDDFNIEQKITSNYFLSQDYIFSIEQNNNVIALLTLKYFNLSKSFYLDDSYFNIWPKEIIDKLKQEGNNYLSCGNLTVKSEYRGDYKGVRVKDLLFSVIREFLKNSTFDGIISATRNLKSVNKSAYSTGAVSLKSNIEYTIKGQQVDLLYWNRHELNENENPNLEKIALKLLKDAKTIKNHTQQENSYVN